MTQTALTDAAKAIGVSLTGLLRAVQADPTITDAKLNQIFGFVRKSTDTIEKKAREHAELARIEAGDFSLEDLEPPAPKPAAKAPPPVRPALKATASGVPEIKEGPQGVRVVTDGVKPLGRLARAADDADPENRAPRIAASRAEPVGDGISFMDE